jgi:uncharacterized Zn-binding protein involved in type VI secretion
MSVSINPPKTPVTEGSSGIAAATLPNVCKMPGPPAPFVPTPLPNIGRSDNSPQGYSTSVMIGGKAVAIQGATFNSMGDVASQGTGGGIVSNNVQGPTSFAAPGSLDVKIEGKNVQLLGDQMLNNGGPSGSPANSATMAGVIQAPGMPVPPTTEILTEMACECAKEKPYTEAEGRAHARWCQLRLGCASRGAEVLPTGHRLGAGTETAESRGHDRHRGSEISMQQRWRAPTRESLES